MSKKEVTKKKGGYDVGYGKPPAKSQFKPGQSGNPKGRPKGQPGFTELLLREAGRLVKLETPNGIQTCTKAEVIMRRLFNAASTGDFQAAKFVMSHMASYLLPQDPTSAESEAATFTLPDEAAISRILARFHHIEPLKEEDE